MKYRCYALVIILVMIVSTACSGFLEDPVEPTSSIDETDLPVQAPIPSDTSIPELGSDPTPTLEPTATPELILPPEPIEIQFTASDGQELSGLGYSAGQKVQGLEIVVRHQKLRG